MASSSGTWSGSMTSSTPQNSGSSVEVLQAQMDERKRKRMDSNRESARRSRMKRQKHLDDLVTLVGELRKENQQIVTDLDTIYQNYIRVAAENSILQAQADELTHWLQSLNEIIWFLLTNSSATQTYSLSDVTSILTSSEY
ncbi:hypothetical protein SAY86_002795 [Trapa natans]|uniref:BZIP domain-containing protein n=1 Tax=Trapa natans TaxID=22666 RepID=A0AAN7R3Q9_TRANT|nr:hypothetical protein SAY86_002795 [Trapa natans]